MSAEFRVFSSSNLEVGKQFVSNSPDGKYVRTLLQTGFVAPNQSLTGFIDRFTPSLDDFPGSNKILCIGAKVISLLQGRYIRKDDIKTGTFARIASRFGTKTEHGVGVAGYPEKLQTAIDEVGMPRVVFASGVSALEKVVVRSGIIKKPIGLFFIIAGKRVEAIDGIVPDGGYHNHVILCPDDYKTLAETLTIETKIPIAIVDINYIGGSVLSISHNAPLTKKEVFSALSDNPFGQDKKRIPLAVIGRN